MNFEGFQHLLKRIVETWYAKARKEFKDDFESIHYYLQESPFTAKQTPENEKAYERLMDVRMKLYELSAEIDANHDAYMEFMQQTLDCPDLMTRVTKDTTTEEKHLMELELMIMEQVADWELDSGKVDSSASQWSKTKHMVVHLPNGSTRTLTIGQENQRRFWFGMCIVSSKIGDMKTCSGCKVVGYLGKDEQTEDWPRHKNLCKLLRKARGNSEYWTAHYSSDQLKQLLREGLGRDLDQFEIDIAEHPRVCIVCGQGDKQSILKNCKSCYCVAFCEVHADKAMAKHEKYCKDLQLAAEDYRNEITLGHQVQNYTPTTVKTYQELGQDIESFFASDISSIVSRKLPGYQESELRYLTFLYSCPLTVLFGLEKSGAKDRSELTLHLVGVRRAELRHLIGWEIIAHRLPSLKSLTLHFIGDESPVGDFPNDFTFKSKELQAERPDLQVRYLLEKPTLYQNFYKSKTFTQPDAIVALDSGFKFYPTWRPALEIMVNQIRCPLIFTEFTLRDQQDNLALLKEIRQDLEVVLEPQKNPFCSKRSVRCSDKSGNYEPFSVIHTNDFICIVK